MERAERNKGNSRSGFSLVELLVAMAITAVVMAAVFKIYTTQQDSNAAKRTDSKIRDDQRDQNGRV
jgi:prepilin-type N-terminal cleavage/methylation domain-containing protein